jgi:hypothetical protein
MKESPIPYCGVCQDTFMSTKRTRMSLWCGDCSMVALHLEAG